MVFFNQQISIDNIKAINSGGKDVTIQKQCGSYSQEDIFDDDTKLCVLKLPLEEKGKVVAIRTAKVAGHGTCSIMRSDLQNQENLLLRLLFSVSSEMQ